MTIRLRFLTTRTVLASSLALLTLAGCGSDFEYTDESPGAGGSAGQAGAAGHGGSAGKGGSAGHAGSAGAGGNAGQAGSAGAGGSAGQAGSAGTGGSPNPCQDGNKNGSETDIDCGGGTCSACADGKKCASNTDCETSHGCNVTTKTCEANLCHDGQQNDDETDVDCGGGTCSGCTVGKKCKTTTDCAADAGCNVDSKTCDADQCHDGIQNGAESDVDCGGTTCTPCDVGKKCDSTADCLTGNGCNASTKVCDATLCTDGAVDGTESDVDCGGSCLQCAPGLKCNSNADCMTGNGCDLTTLKCDSNTCNDGVQDGQESDVDCGGSCKSCAVGQKCTTNADCATGNGCDVSSKSCAADLCSDGLKDGTESDVDCGGACTGCAVGKSCQSTSDCASGAGCDLATKQCDSTLCHDGLKDGLETDIDCGGGTCPACAIGKSCQSTSDCASGGGCDVDTKTCDATTCHDGVKDGPETDVDCGGPCPGCAVGKVCSANTDCLPPEGCNATTKKCDADQCHDGIKNNSESDVDCGGSCPGCVVGKLCGSNSDCLAPGGCDITTKTCDANQCHDGIQDGTESDVDCGGGSCPGCGVNKKCQTTADCATGEGCDLLYKTCDATTCNDGIQDGSETDVDCGGGTCNGCAIAKKCNTTSDCLTPGGCNATTKHCDANMCADGVKDGNETDVDCGGNCNGCAVGKSCNANSDCLSGEGCNAVTKKCDANLCTDQIKDGAETDIDCGGMTCPQCAPGKGCNSNADCMTGNGCNAATKRCDSTLCTDAIKDGNETDVDCGGGTCSTCEIGKACVQGTDCASGNCHSGVCSPPCLNKAYSATGAVQQLTVLAAGTYTIDIAGAQGGMDALGGGNGGLGAQVKGNFPINAGDILQIVVGSRPIGPIGNEDGGGGGGGTFVYLSATAFPLPALPLIVAGGGGGGGGGGGLISYGTGSGGEAGNNGGSGGGAGGGGAGWLGIGGTNGGGGGLQWNGGAGINASGNHGGPGGFGGGGGAGVFNKGVSGGGGGYTGGKGGSVGGPAGAGGSSYLGTTLIAGTSVLTAAAQSGNGYVKIVGPLSGTCP